MNTQVHTTGISEKADQVLVNPKVLAVLFTFFVSLFGYYQYHKDERELFDRTESIKNLKEISGKMSGFIVGITQANAEITRIKEGQQVEVEQRDQLTKEVSSIKNSQITIKQTLSALKNRDDQTCEILNGLSKTYGWQHGCK